jgi:5-amino-6-(5-phosphoribosylamino)uracil reductase
MTGRVRPYVLLSCATSLDGCLDDASPRRLMLSDEADWDRVDAARAASDAILVGAGTIRRDDPRLLVRSAARRADRVARGLPEHPLKVTLTTGVRPLDPAGRFFTTGDPAPAARLVYCPGERAADVAARLGGAATVVPAGDPPALPRVLADLAARGVRRLMVEGGGRVLTRFLAEDLADEIQLVVAPFLVGDADAPRFALPARSPQGPGRPLRLAEARPMGDLVLLRYLTGRTDP